MKIAPTSNAAMIERAGIRILEPNFFNLLTW
jgi:hypothetical protein